MSRTRKQGESFFGEQGKKVLLMSTSPGKNGGATNLKYMEKLMPWWGCVLVGTYSVGEFYQKFHDGCFDTETEAALQEMTSLLESRL